MGGRRGGIAVGDGGYEGGDGTEVQPWWSLRLGGRSSRGREEKGQKIFWRREIVRIQRRRSCSSGFCGKKLGCYGVYLVASSLSYEREHIRSVLFTHAASANLVGLIMSALIWFGPSPPSPDQFLQERLSRASDGFHHNVLCCMNNGVVAA